VFKSALESLKIKISKDGEADAIGGYYSLHNLDNKTVTRSDARNAYYDTVKSRPNLKLIPQRQVTKLITKNVKGVPTVTAVEYAASANGPRTTVTVNVEAIMAAGALHTPQLLQLSGIGDSKLLSQYGIKTVVDLPAVGYNLQDHPQIVVVTQMNFPLSLNNLTTNATFAAESLALYKSKLTGPYSTSTGDLLLFIPAKNYTSAASSIASTASSTDSSTYLTADTPSTVKAGYAQQYAGLTSALTDQNTAFLETIFADGTIVLSLQHPFSRGSVKINSTDPFAPAILDAGLLRNPIDVKLLTEAVGFARKLYATPPMAALSPVELVPGTSTTTDAQLEAYIRANVATLYHPVGTCKMGKKSLGGVVDEEYLVYGTSNLRVVDASVFPELIATHTQQTVYALAEKAAYAIAGV
jgi:choline dehydrogenase-like flavoprotein